MLSEQIMARAECRQLIQIARASLCTFVLHRQLLYPDLDELPPALRERRSTFVTLYNEEDLRGCIGSTGARHPLAIDVVRNTVAAARDPRFPPVMPAEVDAIRLELSVLQPSRPLLFGDYKELLQKLRPGVDGVIIGWRKQRALLLPQVWERLPEPALFLQALCTKAQIPEHSLAADPPEVTIWTFEAYAIHEDDYSDPL